MGRKPSGRSLGVAWRSSPPSLKVTSDENAKKLNKFPGAKSMWTNCPEMSDDPPITLCMF